MSQVIIRCMVVLWVCVVGAGCAAGISQRARSQVTYQGSFAALQRSPRNHMGQVALYGGMIIETLAGSEFSDLIVVQLPLGSGDRPRDVDQSEGRFLVRSQRFLDPNIYQKGRLVTVVGKVVGGENRSIGGLDYAYPVLDAIEIKLWPQEQQIWPNIQFGFGVGAVF